MDTPASLIGSLAERAEEYGKTTYKLSELKLLETTIHVVTSVVSRLGVILIFSMFALVLSIGIALFLGELLGKSYYGFFIVAAFFFVAGIVLYFFFHKWIKKPVSDSIIKQAFQ